MSTERRVGFTMIEIVIAMAVAIILLAAVHSTVQAMTRSAQRIQDEHAEQARLQRFIEILRRDLQGWYEKSENAPPAASAVDAEKPFLRFTTTADSLSPSENEAARAGEIQYALRRSESRIEVVRKETNSGATTDVVVWDTQQIVTIDFQKNNVWVPDWSEKDRPKCVRLILGARTLLITP